MSNQPYIMETDNGEVIVFICNGEIYNYAELSDRYGLNVHEHSDCMVIPALYKKFGANYSQFLELFSHQIKGEFAFIMSVFRDSALSHIICGRDQIGIRPLYSGLYTSINAPEYTTLMLSSEIKACEFFKGDLCEFKPGNIERFFIENNTLSYVDVHTFSWCENMPLISYDPSRPMETFYNSINSTLTQCISRRLNADVPIGFLLSGGVDSSLVCAIAARLQPGKQIRTFCCGMAGGTDFEYAREVANHIGSDHCEVVFTAEEALAVLNVVIYTTETWDTTTIRASVGQYLISSYIAQATDIKVLLVGEGPDEICSSYLFNWYAPSASALHYAATDYVSQIHKYDVRRVDRCAAMWGLEARVPYLDPEFIGEYWKVPASLRDPKEFYMEKYVLRRSFGGDELLPENVLYRRKEAFSDGISSTRRSWFEIIQDHISSKYGMSEEDYYKKTFIELFGVNREKVLDRYWQPKWDESGNEITTYMNPSARVLSVYKSSEYEN